MIFKDCELSPLVRGDNRLIGVRMQADETIWSANGVGKMAAWPQQAGRKPGGNYSMQAVFTCSYQKKKKKGWGKKGEKFAGEMSCGMP